MAAKQGELLGLLLEAQILSHTQHSIFMSKAIHDGKNKKNYLVGAPDLLNCLIIKFNSPELFHIILAYNDSKIEIKMQKASRQ